MNIYYHGGRPGIQRGAFLLPPTITKVRSLADYGAGEVCRIDRVYVTTEFNAALLYAAAVKNGVIYQCEPIGVLEADEDCTTPDMSFHCEKAKVIRCIKPKAKHIAMARSVLMGGTA